MDLQILPALLAVPALLGLFLYWLSKFKKRKRKIKDSTTSSGDESSLVYAASRGAPDIKDRGPSEDSGNSGDGGASD
jgi:hypothetical protein